MDSRTQYVEKKIWIIVGFFFMSALACGVGVSGPTPPEPPTPVPDSSDENPANVTNMENEDPQEEPPENIHADPDESADLQEDAESNENPQTDQPQPSTQPEEEEEERQTSAAQESLLEELTFASVIPHLDLPNCQDFAVGANEIIPNLAPTMAVDAILDLTAPPAFPIETRLPPGIQLLPTVSAPGLVQEAAAPLQNIPPAIDFPLESLTIENNPRIEFMHDFVRGYTLCLFNFPIDETISLTLTAPDDEVYRAKFLISRDGDLRWESPALQGADTPPIHREISGAILVFLDLRPGLFPEGDWIIEARGESLREKANVNFRFQEASISNLPEGRLSPFAIYSACELIARGRLFGVGSHFEPQTTFGLGVYEPANIGPITTEFKLVEGNLITSNDQGFFKFEFDTEALVPGIVYRLIPLVDGYDQSLWPGSSLTTCFGVR